MAVARLAKMPNNLGKIAEHNIVVMRLGMQKTGIFQRSDTVDNFAFQAFYSPSIQLPD